MKISHFSHSNVLRSTNNESLSEAYLKFEKTLESVYLAFSAYIRMITQLKNNLELKPCVVE